MKKTSYRKKILIGHKFGMLEVLEEVEPRPYYDDKMGYVRSVRQVKCKCDCGNYVIRDYIGLPKSTKRGQICNCGCKKYEEKKITRDVGPFIDIKGFKRTEKRELVSKLINEGYTNKEIFVKTNVSSGYVSTLRAKLGKLTFKVKYEIPIGEKFGRLTIKEFVGTKDKHKIVLCECECGTIKEFRFTHVKNGSVNSCGCLMKDIARNLIKNLQKQNFKHGDVRKNSPHNYIFQIWQGMKQRCYNPKNKRYSTYGGRGITVYEPWINDYLLFKEWLLTNLGERLYVNPNKRSENDSLDRINVNLGYYPGNLRWADFNTQANNKSNRKNKDI